VDEDRLTRRASLLRLGGVLGAGIGAAAWKTTASEGAGPAGVASGAIKCVLTPEQSEGPYYLEDEKVRRNIAEGRPGVPLWLRLAVADAAKCTWIRGAAVDIWHCDAGGVYSGFGQGANRTFMRGIQRTNAKGLALFRTVYPGWYPGRSVHVHVKVHLGGNVLHTGQLYFPDSLTDAVYKRAPYNKRSGRRTRNTDDSIYRNGGRRSQLTVRRNASGAYVASIVMGVMRS
jgi:protocatechuate 3,4-dioxygenase beta subunit